MVVEAAAAAAVVVVVRGEGLSFGARTFRTFCAQQGQHAWIGRVVQGQRGDGMRVLGVFESWAGKCAF